MKWALPFHNCITCCMTTPQKLACWLLHSNAACGQAYCKHPGARSVAPWKARYLFVPCCTCCMADVMSMSTTATLLFRMPQIKCATPWAVSNSDELSTTHQIVVVEHWLFTSQSLWRHGCVPVSSQQRSEWKPFDGMVKDNSRFWNCKSEK